MTNNQKSNVQELQRVVIKEELMALIETYYGNKQGIHMRAAFLNNLIFWQGIQLKTDKKQLIKIERAYANNLSKKSIEKMEDAFRDGWFYKTADEHSIELMGFCSPSSITRMNKEFAEQSWLKLGKNPDKRFKYDQSTWYKLDLEKINSDLNKLGYHLDGFKFVKVEETPVPPNFHGENSEEYKQQSNFHGEKSYNFHGENSNDHHERAITEGITEGLSKRFEEEEDIITLQDVTSFLNQQITKREITNKKTLTAIYEVAEKCKAIGTNDVQAMESFCITVVEEKISKFGQKQREVKKSNNNRNKPIRTELIPDHMKDGYQQPAAQQNEEDLEKQKQKNESMLKQLRA